MKRKFTFKNMKSIYFMLFAYFINIQIVNSQITLETNIVIAKPFEIFGSNINRDAIFGLNLGVLKYFTSNSAYAIGLQYNYFQYGVSAFIDFQSKDDLSFRQTFKTKATFHTFQVVFRHHFFGDDRKIKPYFDGLGGINWFLGATRSKDAYFIGDTNNDGLINFYDGEIDPSDFGKTPSFNLPRSSYTINHSSISPTIGLGLGVTIKIENFISFDSRLTYNYGFYTSYFDYGSQTIVNNSADYFTIVSSTTSTIQWSMGFSFSLR